MRAVKPNILRKMDEETQTEVGAAVKAKVAKARGEKDIDTKENTTGAGHVAIDKHNVMYCDKHPDKKIEYYCRIHGELPCSRCAIENHRKCQGMSIIEDIASLPRTQKDVFRVSEKIEDAAFQIDTQRQMDKRVLSNLDESVERINLELKYYKDKMYKITDSIETRLTKRTDKLYKDRNRTVTGHLDLLNDTGAKVEKLKEAMEILQTTESDAERFVILQKVKKAFTTLSTPIHNLHRDAIDVQLNLRMNIDLDKTLEHIDKKMTVEVKTMRRGEQITKDRNAPDVKRKGGRKADPDAVSTARSTKSTGRKEGPHKFLAQRNFKPYKIPPYIVEKKPPPVIRGGHTSLRKSKPIIVISGENIGAQATSKRHAAAMFDSIESIPEKEHLEIKDTSINKDRQKVERSRHNKTVPGQSKAVKYTWGNYSSAITVNESKHAKGTESAVNKSPQNYRYNKSVFQSFDRNRSKEEIKDKQTYSYKKSGASSDTNPGLYRNYKMSERQKQKQDAFDKIEKLAHNMAKPNPVIKVPGSMSQMDEKDEMNTSKTKHTKADGKINTNDGKSTNDKANVTVPFKKHDDKFNGEQVASGNGNMVLDGAEKDSGIALETFNESIDKDNDVANTIKNGSKSPVKTKEHGKDIANDVMNENGNKNKSHENCENIDKVSPKLESKDAHILGNEENHQNGENSNKKFADYKQDMDIEDPAGPSEKLNKEKEENKENENLVKAFVTDISMDSETKLLENTIEKRMKTKSADRLRVPKSDGSLQRAKSDK